MLKKNLLVAMALVLPFLFSACSDEKPPVKPPGEATHIWKDQVNTLQQAKDIAKLSEENQAQAAQRIEDIRGMKSSEDNN